MAFTVVPTSGDAPYILSANISQSAVIDGVYYYATLRSAVAVGNCPLTTGGTLLPSDVVMALVAGDSVDSGLDTVPAGSCRVFTLRLHRVSDNTVVSFEQVTVDNI